MEESTLLPNVTFWRMAFKDGSNKHHSQKGSLSFVACRKIPPTNTWVIGSFSHGQIWCLPVKVVYRIFAGIHRNLRLSENLPELPGGRIPWVQFFGTEHTLNPNIKGFENLKKKRASNILPMASLKSRTFNQQVCRGLLQIGNGWVKSWRTQFLVRLLPGVMLSKLRRRWKHHLWVSLINIHHILQVRVNEKLQVRVHPVCMKAHHGLVCQTQPQTLTFPLGGHIHKWFPRFPLAV